MLLIHDLYLQSFAFQQHSLPGIAYPMGFCMVASLDSNNGLYQLSVPMVTCDVNIL